MTKLKLWNGNAQTMAPYAEVKKRNIPHNGHVHVYACAGSRAEVLRMLQAWTGDVGLGRDSYVRDYWNAGAWGNTMDGIVPERGLWVQYGHGSQPERVWPLIPKIATKRATPAG